MMQRTTKCLLTIILLIGLFAVPTFTVHAQSRRIKAVASLYDSLRSHKIAHPKTVLAIAIYETGWMQCKSCALEYNNLFGFRTNKDFLKFSNTSESIRYLKRWQSRYYKPWQARHPEGTYYEYLRYIRYCDNMDSYIRNIKNIEEWLSLNIEGVK